MIRITLALAMAVSCLAVTAQNVGVNTNSPDSTLSITNKLLIGGSQGDVVFTDDEGSIQFPATTAPNESMIYMFSSGFSNADRMVISHSPAFPDWGLRYRDDADVFTFMRPEPAVPALDIDLTYSSVGIGIEASTIYSLGVSGQMNIVNGAEASLTTNGYLQTGSTTGQNLVMDNNEITSRNNGQVSTLWLQPNQGNVVVGTTGSNTTSTLHVSSDAGENPLRVQLIGSTKFLIDSTGTVLVNGFNKKPGYEFNVDGQIACEEVLVQNSTNWPDYVFDAQYDLPTLEEVEHHITNFKHLPSVPSAAEIEANGIELAEMEKTILRKVEELTLYVIQQSKEIKALQQENAELRAMIEKQ